MYGVYDLSGGTWERIADYVANENNNLKTYGANIAYDGSTLKTISTKYTTAYPFDSSTDNAGISNTETNIKTASSNNYKENQLIYGDGVRETSTDGVGSTSWYNDYSSYPGLHRPFSVRGGSLWNGSGASFFSFTCVDGVNYYSHGFRTVLVVS